MKKVRKALKHRFAALVSCRKYFNRNEVYLQTLVLADLLAEIRIRSRNGAERGLMIDAQSALMKKDYALLAEIADCWNELQQG